MKFFETEGGNYINCDLIRGLSIKEVYDNDSISSLLGYVIKYDTYNYEEQINEEKWIKSFNRLEKAKEELDNFLEFLNSNDGGTFYFNG